MVFVVIYHITLFYLIFTFLSVFCRDSSPEDIYLLKFEIYDIFIKRSDSIIYNILQRP
jgi:hypothetical protein